MQRQANAVWRGSLQKGRGEMSTLSGALKQIPYTYSTRFEESPGTNPEEMVAAAHSSCFSMYLAGALSAKGYEPESLDVVATVTLLKEDSGWRITSSHLRLKAHVANVTQGQFLEIAEDAKKNCPVSKLLNVEISLEAHLEESASQPWSPPPPH